MEQRREGFKSHLRVTQFFAFPQLEIFLLKIKDFITPLMVAPSSSETCQQGEAKSRQVKPIEE